MDDLLLKKQYLKEYLCTLGRLIVAFSSGVDSTFLLKTAHDILGDDVIAVTARLNSFPNRELDEAKEFCKKESIRHIVFDFNELEIDGFCSNPPDRCYLCKKAIFKKIMEIAKNNNIENIAEGSNIDDDGDYRPGMKAVKELKIKSPLKEAGLTKAEIRTLSREMNLATWDKPSFACLSSRFAYGETITKEKLSIVGRAEQCLIDLGFNQVRVRMHGKIARIEIKPSEFSKIIQKDTAKQINEYFQELGFEYVTLDLGGYKTGSMNKTLL